MNLILLWGRDISRETFPLHSVVCETQYLFIYSSQFATFLQPGRTAYGEIGKREYKTTNKYTWITYSIQNFFFRNNFANKHTATYLLFIIVRWKIVRVKKGARVLHCSFCNGFYGCVLVGVSRSTFYFTHSLFNWICIFHSQALYKTLFTQQSGK